MHLALRPYMTTGVALVGASVIAVSPIAPPPAQIEAAAQRVSSAAVELTAAFDPITAYTQLFTNTFNNLAALTGEVAADPAPILEQVIRNTVGNARILGDSARDVATGLVNTAKGLPPAVKTAADQLSAGNFAGAVDTLFSYLVSSVLFQVGLPLITGPVTVAQNVVGNINNVVQNGILSVLLVALAPIYPINATVSAFGALGQDIIDSVETGDVVGVVKTLVAAPAVLADAFLNGFPEGVSSLLDPAGGLLTPASVGFGTIENILQARKAIAALLTRPEPPAAASVTGVDTTSDNLVTLDVPSDLQKGADVEDKSGQEGTEGSTAGTVSTPEESDEASDAGTEGTKTTILDRLTKRTNGATDLSDGNAAVPGGSESAPGPRHRALSVVGDLQDNLAAKREGLRTALGNLGKDRGAKSGGDESGASGGADSGGADSGGDAK